MLFVCPRQRINSALDQYELAVDEIVAACDGDLRGALRALMLFNEQLEQELARMSGSVLLTSDCTNLG
ncbi:hypothetical protein [Bradyrhizobium sp. i1.15.2]|uniref:hypothetical protein n=1 Tax=Bradyrhizobium sp. i1.15.2 TaxID=3156362 RepID=UPI0033990B76